MTPTTPTWLDAATGRLVVTGAASGIGGAVVRLALERGWAVAALDREPRRLQRTWGHSPVLTLAADVTDESAVAEAFVTAREHWGDEVTAVVHSAGLYQVEATVALSVSHWRQVLDVNATGSFLLARELGRRVGAGVAVEPAGSRGSIVLLTSIAHERGDSHEPAAHYSASKGAVVSLTRQLAVEWGPTGIRVNAVSPGVIDTPMLRLRDDPARLDTHLRDGVPLGRLGLAEEVASACLFLVGDQATYITGAVLPVDGGAHVA
jgi:NAD(P)-dependent dehydrogenase (short-subunit alcohol dehydrogenase family)